MERFVVAVTRTCGSGGTTISKMLADDFGIDMYDRKLLRLASDDSGISEGSNSSVEFFVYNYDATKDEFQGGKSNIVLDMTKLGIEKGKKCKVTEMWHNKDMGKYKNKQFKVRLMPHASALYKITED